MPQRRRRYRLLAAGACLLVLGLTAASCGGGGAKTPTGARPPEGPVVIASFNFPESELMAEIYAQALTARGIPVRLEADLGTRELVLPAFERSLVDLVPEYIGSALQALAPDSPVDMSNTAAVMAGLTSALRPWHGLVLAPSPAQDQNGLAVSRLTATQYGLRDMSDLRPFAGELALAATPECPQRPYCLEGFGRVYGLRFGSELPLATEEERVTALHQRVADVALVFSTSPNLAGSDLVLLDDDRHLQPAENIAPVVSDRALGRYGARIEQALGAVSARLDTQEVRFLNWRVSVEGRSAAEEAHGWLVRQGLVPRP